jgi:hypothetical protein
MKRRRKEKQPRRKSEENGSEETETKPIKSVMERQSDSKAPRERIQVEEESKDCFFLIAIGMSC